MIEIVFDIYGVTQKKIGLFWKHVGKHFPCLLHRLYVNFLHKLKNNYNEQIIRPLVAMVSENIF